MSVRPVDILQRIHNKVGTVESGWNAWAEASTQAFDAAYTLHKGALTVVKEEARTQAEAVWGVLNLLLAGTVGTWVGKMLAPAQRYAQGQIDQLTAVWVKDALQSTGKDVQKLIEGTVMDQFKKRAVGSTSDPYEPVIESSLIHGSRLKEGIANRAYNLKEMMNGLIAAPDSWTIPAATSLEKEYLNRCPYIVDMPTDTGDEFKKQYQRDAEWEMWRAWGMARDEKWWSERPNHMDQWTMAPILQRLLTIGVPQNSVATYATSGTSIASARRGYRLDMLKFINWARTSPSKTGSAALNPPEQVCRVPFKLELKRPDNVCYGSSGM